MNCDPLPSTGLDATVMLVLAIAVVCLLLGLGLLLRVRRSASNPGATLLLAILVGSGVLIATGPTWTAFGAPSECTRHHSGDNTEPADEPDNWLTITQTSTVDNLAPDVPPAEISGLVVNNGPDSTYITAIAVEIVGVVRRLGSAAGTCDASDYVLSGERMSVDRTLGPNGGSATFSGATIGFNNKTSRQDACQGASVQLRYTTAA